MTNRKTVLVSLYFPLFVLSLQFVSPACYQAVCHDDVLQQRHHAQYERHTDDIATMAFSHRFEREAGPLTPYDAIEEEMGFHRHDTRRLIKGLLSQTAETVGPNPQYLPLEPIKIIENMPREIVVGDNGDAYIAPRETETRLIYRPTETITDSEIILSSFETYMNALRHRVTSWHEENDLPVGDWSQAGVMQRAKELSRSLAANNEYTLRARLKKSADLAWAAGERNKRKRA